MSTYVIVIYVNAEEHGLGLTDAADPPHGPCPRRHERRQLSWAASCACALSLPAAPHRAHQNMQIQWFCNWINQRREDRGYASRPDVRDAEKSHARTLAHLLPVSGSGDSSKRPLRWQIAKDIAPSNHYLTAIHHYLQTISDFSAINRPRSINVCGMDGHLSTVMKLNICILQVSRRRPMHKHKLSQRRDRCDRSPATVIFWLQAN